MNKGFLASCLVMTTAACLGYWILSDSIGPRRCRNSPSISSLAAELEAETTIPAVPARQSGEFISLERVFDATGQELDLQYLLESLEVDYLPPPRVVALAPVDDVGEEESSWFPASLRSLKEQFQLMVARKFAELIGQIQPLMGTEPPPEEATPETKPFGGVVYPLNNATTEVRPGDMPK